MATCFAWERAATGFAAFTKLCVPTAASGGFLGLGYSGPTRPQGLTPAEDEVEADTRQRLADYLGCHEDVRAAAWDAWADLLDDAPEVDPDAAEYWLDVEFVEPCPQ